MSDTDRLAQIEARLDAATPGPWGRVHLGLQGGEVIRNDSTRVRVARTYLNDDDRSSENADLIANAPADLRYLLDRLREAEEASLRHERERNRAVVRAEKAEAALARVEALADEFDLRQARNAAHNGGVSCSVWGLAGAELHRVLGSDQ